MPTPNEELRDLFLARQVGIHRLSLREQRYLQRLIAQALREANRELARRLEIIRATGIDSGPFVTRQINRTIRILSAILTEHYRAAGSRFERRMLALTLAEVQATQRAIRAAIPGAIEIEWAFPGESILRAIVRKNPMQGHVLGSYFARTTRASLVKRLLLQYRKLIRAAVAEGLLRSLSVDQVARRITGQVRGLAFRHARTVADTATKHVTQSARQAFLLSNSGPEGVVKGLQWLSTLDLRTTKEFCIPRDGRLYGADLKPKGHNLPWLEGPGRIHWGCRSTFTAVLKSWRELGVDANELTGAERASMDGQIAAETTIRDWMVSREWTGAELREMFGVRRAERIEAGELTIRGALRILGIYA